MKLGRAAAIAVVAAASALLLAAATVAWLNRDDALDQAQAPASGADLRDLVARGEYLVRAGSCLGCHTDAGGAAYAGGRAIETPFGIVHAPNLTPDAATGLGAWSSDDFWRALHNGRAREGRLLYPAFPYPNYTRLTRADAEAMFAYLKSLAPIAKANKPHALSFPFDRQAALAVWRALFFRPGRFESDSSQTPQWNRGAYLVETLGHCNACHSRRNVFGATAGPLDLAGGLIPIQNWYAPSLKDNAEAGVGDWPDAEVVALLKTGVSALGSTQGPMAEVVARSTQFLSDADLAAMASYLRSLAPATPRATSQPTTRATAQTATTPATARDPGAELYKTHCAACHGDDGAGVAGAYPRLAGNRAIMLSPPANLVHMIRQGGFLPVTAGNRRPFGMPPYATVLSDDDIAKVLTHLRSSWGQHGAPVSTLEVSRYRGSAAR
jgi:mono/diheme cytochrome c family protein